MQSSMLRAIVEDFGNGGTIDGDVTITGDLTVSGGGSLSFDEILEGTQVIDVTSTEAFLVRKNSDGGDVFVVDSTNSRVGIGGAPSQLLTVSSSSADAILAIDCSHAGSDGMLVIESATGRDSMIRLTEADTIKWQIYNDGSDSDKLKIQDDGDVRVTFDQSGNVGIGVVPEAWYGDYTALQIGGAGSLMSNTAQAAGDSTYLSHNCWLDLTNNRWEYISTNASDEACQIRFQNGTIIFRTEGTAASNSTAITFTSNMILDENSRISLSNNDGGGTNGDSSTTGNTILGYSIGDTVTDTINNTFIGHKVAGGGTKTSGTQNNVGVGNLTMYALTSGANNTAVGKSALNAIDTGEKNVMIGATAGDAIDGETNNVGIGYGAMGGAVNGADKCIAIGSDSLSGAITQDGTIAIGHDTLAALTSGSGNTAVGYQALKTEDTGANSTAVGYQALTAQNTGDGNNTAVGYLAASAISTGYGNVMVGTNAGKLVTTGTSNVVLGNAALAAADGNEANNIVIGGEAGAAINSDTADNNILIGQDAGTGGAAAMISCIAIGKSAMNSTAANAQTGTIAIGQDALTALTTGERNLALGYQAADALTQGDDNVAIGHSALGGATTTDGIDKNVAVGNGAMSGTNAGAAQNVAIGYAALDGNMTSAADNNTAVGYYAASGITSGTDNTAMGNQVAVGMTTGQQNVMIGSYASYNTVDADKTVMIGYNAGGTGNQSSDGSVAVGHSALLNLTSGAGNIAVGYQSLAANTTGANNLMIGYQAGVSANDGNFSHNIGIGNYVFDGVASGIDAQYNVAIGYASMSGVLTDTAHSNTAVGKDTLLTLTSGANNTAIGTGALDELTAGSFNVAIGSGALHQIDGGETNNTAIGYLAGANADGNGEGTFVGANTSLGTATDNDNVIIGESATGGGTNSIVIGADATGVAANSVTLGNASVTAVYMAQDSGATVNCGQVVSANTAIDTTGGFTGFSQTYKKTLGVTNVADNFIGTFVTMEFDDDGAVDATFGTLAGARIYSICTDSVGAGSTIYGTDTLAKLSVGNPDNVYGAYTMTDIDGGTVDSDVYGQFIDVDIESGCTISNDVLGIQCNVDADTNPAGGVNGLYLRMMTNADKFVDMFDGTASTDRFEILISGVVNAEGTINASQSMDYAEYFESKDGKEIAVGTTVKLDGNQIVSCSDGDTPLGVIRPKSGNQIVGGGQVFHWKDQFDKDDYGANIWEDYSLVKWSEEITFEEYTKRGKDDTGGAMGGILTDSKVEDTYFREHKYHSDRLPDGVTAPDDAEVIEVAKQRQKLNPDYDASKTYKSREERDEWHVVGLLGQIPITKGQPTGSWIKMKDVSDTVEMYFVK